MLDRRVGGLAQQVAGEDWARGDPAGAECGDDLVTAATRRSLRELAARIAMLDGQAERVEVDLSEVVFMDSSALSALVGAHERASRQSQKLALVSPSPACTKVLAITGLDRVFDLN